MGLIRKLGHKLKEAIRPKALILMYHRIARLESDIWDIAVSPDHFEQQLQVLKKGGKVVSLKALAKGVRNGHLQRGSMAITFDDGYIDNFLEAMPLLEKYELPATFFITSCNLGQEAGFWWDELEQLILFKPQLPEQLSIKIGDQLLAFELGTESNLTDHTRQQHQQWQACEQAPPSRRASIYFQLWQAMRPLPHSEQQKVLGLLRDWASLPFSARKDYRSMDLAQLKELAGSDLFDIGIHTLTHPALAHHAPEYQQHEILANRQFLEETCGNKVNLLAYPFGNYNMDTLSIASGANLLAAVTTEEELVKTSTNPYRLGRFQVKNWTGTKFEQHLQQWRNAK